MSSQSEELSTVERQVDDQQRGDVAPRDSEPEAPKQPTLFGRGEPAEPDHDTQPGSSFASGVLAFEGEPSLVYLGSLLGGSALLIAGAYLEAFPWLATLVGIVTLLATMFRGGRWVSLGGGAAMVIIILISLWPHEQTLADVRAAGGNVGTSSRGSEEEQAPEGSLAIRVGEVPELWNELDQQPLIRRGLVRNPERGQFDSFVYQFDSTASLAGAYDPEDDYVYAVLASIWVNHEHASGMYLHLCFMFHPYSQECIDTYRQRGLEGGSLQDYVDVDRSAEWEIDGLTWRLSISGNVQNIRVVGSGA